MFTFMAKLFGSTQEPVMTDLQRLKSMSPRNKEYDISRPDIVNKARVQRRDSESMALLKKEDRRQSAWATADMADRIYNRG
jgi:hypothetical protein